MHFLTAPSSWFLSPHLTPSLIPPLSPAKVRQFAVLNELGSPLVDSFWKGNCYYKALLWSCFGFSLRCKDSEGEFSFLKSEVLEFMQSFDKLEVFPIKEELLAARRVDLVNAILNEEGWLSYGWDLNDGSSESLDFEDRSRGKIEGNATRASGVASSSSKSDESV